MSIVLRPWAHYVDFEGRSSRTEYILFHLVTYLGAIGLVVVAMLLTGGIERDMKGRDMPALVVAAVSVCALLWLAAIIPGWAVAIRRAHDMGQSGWMVLLFFVPFFGFLFHLVLAFAPGQEGENEYGWDPREGDAPEGYGKIERGPRQVARVTRSQV